MRATAKAAREYIYLFTPSLKRHKTPFGSHHCASVVTSQAASNVESTQL